MTPKTRWVSIGAYDGFYRAVVEDAAGAYVWSCSHRHMSLGKAQFCAIRNSTRIERKAPPPIKVVNP